MSLRPSEVHTKYAIWYVPPLAKVIRSYCYVAARIRIPSGTVSQRRRILRTIHLSGIRRLRRTAKRYPQYEKW